MGYRRYRSDHKENASAVETTMKGIKVPFGFVLEVTHLSAYDETESGNTVNLGYLTATEDFVTVQSSTDTDYYGTSLSGPIWIEGGETPAAKITTPGASDALSFSCHGRLWPEDSIGVVDAKVQRETDLSD